MKRILALVVALLVAASMFAGCSKKDDKAAETPKVKVGLATDEGGKGDKSFNDSAIAGLDQFKSETGVTPQILESKQVEQYEPNLKVLSQGNDLIFAVGFKMQQATETVAKSMPDKKFAIIDSEVKLPNVLSISFKEEEGSFLMGVVAGKMTKTNKVGFLGGMKMPLIEKFEAGFTAGVKAVNPSAQVVPIYAESFSDVGKGVEIGKTLYNGGCDVVYHAAGGVGIGLFNAAKELKKYAIGVDSDQALLLPDKADVILCSMMKRVNVATYNASMDMYKGEFKAGSKVLGLKEDGVGISDTVNPAVTKDILDLAAKYKQAIIDGKFVVPTTPKEAKAFVAPQI